MKRTIISITTILIVCSFSTQAQNNAIDKYYAQYADDERFTKVSISSKMFSLFTNFNLEDESEQQVVETISKLKGLKMLIGNEIENAHSIYGDVISKPSKQMEELMTVEKKDQELIFFISETNGTISELLMCSYESQNVIILSLIGDIDLQEIAELSSKMDIEGFDNLLELDKK